MITKLKVFLLFSLKSFKVTKHLWKLLKKKEGISISTMYSAPKMF